MLPLTPGAHDPQQSISTSLNPGGQKTSILHVVPNTHPHKIHSLLLSLPSADMLTSVGQTPEGTRHMPLLSQPTFALPSALLWAFSFKDYSTDKVAVPFQRL